MDFPWWEVGGGKIKRGANKHYPLIKTKDGPKVIQDSGLWNFEDNAHAWFWVTSKFLLNGEALWLINKLGFTPKSHIVWNKPGMGIGQYFRGKHEICILAVRGKGLDTAVCTDRRDLVTSYDWDYRRDANKKIIHSGKPFEFYDLVESRSKGPYCEFFARERHLGWEAFGDQI